MDFGLVIDVSKSKKYFILSEGDGEVSPMYFQNEEFDKTVYLYRRWLKKQFNPDDRVAPFESLDKEGIFCLKTYAKVFNSRLTPSEKNLVLKYA